MSLLEFTAVALDREDVLNLELARKVMLKTYALIHDPKRHTTGVSARDINHRETSAYGEDAVQFCLVGGRNRICDRLDAMYREDISLPLFDRCAVELHGPEIEAIRHLRPAAYANDTYGHEAALKILRCSMAKVRAELQRRKATV